MCWCISPLVPSIGVYPRVYTPGSILALEGIYKKQDALPTLYNHQLYNISECQYNMFRNSGITDKQLYGLFVDGVNIKELNVSDTKPPIKIKN